MLFMLFYATRAAITQHFLFVVLYDPALPHSNLQCELLNLNYLKQDLRLVNEIYIHVVA